MLWTDVNLASKGVFPPLNLQKIHDSAIAPYGSTPLIHSIRGPVLTKLHTSIIALNAAHNAEEAGLEFEEFDEAVVSYTAKLQVLFLADFSHLCCRVDVFYFSYHLVF